MPNFNVEDSKSVFILVLNVGIPVDYGDGVFPLIKSGFLSDGSV